MYGYKKILGSLKTLLIKKLAYVRIYPQIYYRGQRYSVPRVVFLATSGGVTHVPWYMPGSLTSGRVGASTQILSTSTSTSTLSSMSTSMSTSTEKCVSTSTSMSTLVWVRVRVLHIQSTKFMSISLTFFRNNLLSNFAGIGGPLY